MTFDEFIKKTQFTSSATRSAMYEWEKRREEYERIKWQEELSRWKNRESLNDWMSDGDKQWTTTNPHLGTKPSYSFYDELHMSDFGAKIFTTSTKPKDPPMSFDDAMGFGGA